MKPSLPPDNPAAPTVPGFLYALGQHVRWAGGVGLRETPWQVLQQRLTVTMVSEVPEYLLIAVHDPGAAPVWAYEADLTPWERSQ